ncbi:MAG: hypothetical protein M1819_001042 [Sarea resinae]|nr:MAG: hypothetical protein M1819_001042 [Sarea resinae]
MRFSIVAAAAALVAGVSAASNGTEVYTTEVVTAFTTYCPEATSLVHNNKTYTVTEATTLTITNCPCTVTKPLTSGTPAPIASTAPAASPSLISTIPPYINGTGTVPTSSGAASGTGSATASTKPVFTGAANQAFAASGAGLAGLLGLAAFVL